MKSKHDVVVIEADEPYYQEVLALIVRSLAARDLLVEPADLGCFYVGLNDSDELFQDEARLTTSLMAIVPHYFNPRVGLAQTKLAAYAAAVVGQPGRTTRAPDDVAAFLSSFSSDLLPISVEAKMRLHEIGLSTIGLVQSRPVEYLAEHLGKEGARAWDFANGFDDRALVNEVSWCSVDRRGLRIVASLARTA